MVGVDCTFNADGTILVRRIFLDGRWVPVEQGRQWLDRHGRHVLIMFANGDTREINLRPDSMTWEILPTGKPGQFLV